MKIALLAPPESSVARSRKRWVVLVVMANQAAGTAQDLYGQAADTARDTAATFDKWLRNTIETQPYTTAIVALGIWMAVGTDASATLVVNIFGNCAPPQLPSGGVLFLRQTTI